MLALYLIFIAVGVIYLGAALVGLGEHHLEFHHDVSIQTDLEGHDGNASTSIFSMRTIAVFLLTFGIAGLSVYMTGGGVGKQLLVGFGSGIAVGGFVGLVMKFLYSMQGSSNVTSTGLIGTVGIVVIGTTSTGSAMIKVATNAGFKEYICKEKTGALLNIGDSATVSESVANILIVTKSTQ